MLRSTCVVAAFIAMVGCGDAGGAEDGADAASTTSASSSSAASSGSGGGDASSSSSTGAGGEAPGRLPEFYRTTGLASGLALDDTYVYVADPDAVPAGIVRIHRETRAVTTFHETSRACGELELGGGQLYAECRATNPAWNLLRLPLDGGAPDVLLESEIVNPRMLAAADAGLYLYVYPELQRIDLGTTTPVALVNQALPSTTLEAVLDATNYYALRGSDVMALPLAGGSAVTLADNPAAKTGELVQNATHLFHFLESSGIQRTSKSGGASEGVAGAENAQQGGAIGADDESLFFFQSEELHELPVDGGVSTSRGYWDAPSWGPVSMVVEPDAVWVLIREQSAASIVRVPR